MRKADPFLVRLMVGLWRPKVRILGIEFSGTVESVGDAVTRFARGDQVFGTSRKFGCHAQYVCVPEARGVAKKPQNMTFEQAAAVLFGGGSALYFLRKAKVAAGQEVLIYGASSSVGVFAIQLAKYFGAHVTGVCSTANLEMVKSLGADEVIDYTREDFSKAGRIYDVIVDTVGKSGFSRTMRSLKRGGRYAQVVGVDLSWVFRQMWVSITGAGKIIAGVARPGPGDQAFLKELIETGKLRTVIDKCYTLEQIREAHRHAEAGHKKGHVVIVLEPAQ